MWESLKVQFREQVWDNEQVLKLRQKFAELDKQTQSYVVIGSFGAFVLFLFFSFIAFWVSASSLKGEIAAIDENIRFVQSSAAKIEELKQQAQSQNRDSLTRDLDASMPIDSLLQKIIQKAMIPKASAEIGAASGGAVDLTLTKISLRQLVRILYMLEHSNAGAQVDKLNADTKGDSEGYISVTLTVRKLGGI